MGIDSVKSEILRNVYKSTQKKTLGFLGFAFLKYSTQTRSSHIAIGLADLRWNGAMTATLLVFRSLPNILTFLHPHLSRY